MEIRFGTSGWRAVVADQFTFANKQVETEAICNHLQGVGHAAETVAARGTSLAEQLNQLHAKMRKLESGRIGLALTPEVMRVLTERLKGEPPDSGGRVMSQTNRIDGEIHFCGWFLVTDALISNRTTR